MLIGEKLGEAIRVAIQRKHVSLAEVARLFDVKPPSVQGWMTTGRISKPNFEKLRIYLADVVGPEHWGMPGGHGIQAKAGLTVTKHTPHPMASMARQGLGHAVADADDQAITVPVFDVAASCGMGSLQPEHEPIIDFVRLSRAWVQRHLVFTAPANLAVVSAYGDSMQPTFSDGDILLVDTGVTEIRLDAIYMLECKQELFIKRIQRRIGGGGHIMVSDNQSYRDQEIDMKRIKVLGRVIWAWNGKNL